MKKVLSIILAIMLIISIVPISSVGITANAENTVIDVYDAQTLVTALRTSNADIVLWNDITCGSSVTVLCHSIDLNGYKLVCNNKMTLASDVEEFIILDSLFSSDAENTGELKFNTLLDIGISTFIIQSGIVSAAKGISGSGNIEIYDGVINICGINGTNGVKGKDGSDGKDGDTGDEYIFSDGYDGTYGTSGTSGTYGLQSSNLYIYGGDITVYGGNGGNGGDGTVSGTYPDSCCGGDGGNGGAGGSNSHGSEAILANNFIIYDGDVYASGGLDSIVGGGGVGGTAGTGYGDPNGNKGANGLKGKYNGNGGAGINADFIMYGGKVTAIGACGGAGIGGSGYTEEISGHNVNIYGGYVFADGGAGAFDIGGGYDGSKTGEATILEVTGGTLRFATYGRATNVSSPIFKNCTVTGEGAYQHEGTYNADGKFTVAVQDIVISPETCVGYDEVTLKATLNFSRTTNITTPSPRGKILFKLDGKDIGNATIKNAVSNSGKVTADATIDWIAVEGEHIITAEYIAATSDKYASAGAFKFDADITAHTHNWESDFTVDVAPSCLTVGSKSIHCSICDAQKDITEIPETGHNYVNNQCENCEEFLPLIVFKDYDGTILSSEYYYIGDEISVPDAPTRDEDNTYTYKFIGWDKEVVACDGDKTYTAVYESTYKNYTITFKNWDNTVILTKDDYHYGDVVTPPATPTKPSDKIGDYNFAGWDTPIVNCDGDKTYIAVYSTSYTYYKVEFKNWDGQVISSKMYKYGAVIDIPEDPVRTTDMIGNYIFNGWDSNVTNCYGDKVYTATYLTNYTDYTITFKDWDDSVISAKTYHYGDKVEEPADPTRSVDNKYTYIFIGWDKDVTDCYGNKVYTATYASNYINYTVTFKNYDDTVLSTKTYHYGDTVIVPTTPTKPNDNIYTYTFAGWDSDITVCKGNKVYKAVYTSDYIHYAVIFKNYDGTVLSNKTYRYGDTVIVPNAPTKPKDNTYTYTFAGWDSDITVCKGNKVYTAVYNPNYIDYTVTFKNYNGDVLSNEIYHYGDIVQQPNTPIKEKDLYGTYTFNGWDKVVTVCEGDIVYTATYLTNYTDYTITFKNWDNSIITTKTYHYGDTVIPPSIPTRPDDDKYTYTFAGWDSAITVCYGDKVYTATFSSKVICVNHIYEEYIKQDDAYHTCICSVCGEVETKVHTWNSGTVTEVANCKKTGTKTYICTAIGCGAMKTEIIAKTDSHTFGSWIQTKAPTLTDKGIEERVCSTCQKVEAREIAVMIGWNLNENGWWYQNEDGSYIANNWLNSGGSWYYFNALGIMQTGWLNIGGSCYYLNSSGAMVTGWLNYGGTWYYFNASGAMVTGWLNDCGTWYYFNDSGEMITDWASIGGTWYYFNSSGAMVTGWLRDGGTWYYFNVGGAMATGWQSVGGTWYYFNVSGAMLTGWQYIGGTWYYFNAGGAMVTDWQLIDGNWYYFYSSGAMAANCYIDNYWLTASGAMA